MDREFKVVKMSDKYWCVFAFSGRWYGADLKLDKKGAEEIQTAMTHAYLTGKDDKIQEIHNVLKLD